jgi:hypothetical protein
MKSIAILITWILTAILLVTLACSYQFIDLGGPAGDEIQATENEQAWQDSSEVGFASIRGVVKDLETCEGIPGVIIMLEDTLIGTASNCWGDFLIRNVPPGSYTLIAKTIGYNSFIVEDLIIGSDVIIEMDVIMQSIPNERGGCPMWRPVYEVFIDRYQTSNQETLYQYGIETMPVSTVDDILKKTQGFVR